MLYLKHSGDEYNYNNNNNNNKVPFRQSMALIESISLGKDEESGRYHAVKFRHSKLSARDGGLACELLRRHGLTKGR